MMDLDDDINSKAARIAAVRSARYRFPLTLGSPWPRSPTSEFIEQTSKQPYK